MELTKLKKELFTKIKSIKIDGLVSIALVGSFQYSTKLEKVSDVDLVVVVKKLTPKVFHQINDEFNRISKTLTNKKEKYVVETRIGPFKPQPLKKTNLIQLHVLMYGIPLWMQRTRSLAIIDWINFNTNLYGKQLRSIRNIQKISKKELLRDFEVSLSNLQSTTTYTRVFKIQGNEVISEKQHLRVSRREHKEAVPYSIIQTFLNYIRFSKPKTKKDKAILLKEASKIFSATHVGLLKEAFGIKERLKAGKKVTDKEFNDLKNDGIELIRYLQSRVIE